jgi:PhnB protein
MSSKQIAYKPDNYPTLSPAIAIQGADRAIDWYKTVFGAREAMRMDGPGGRVMHAELDFGESRIMLGEEDPQYTKSPVTLGGSTVALSLYVENVDEVVDRAVRQGAKVLIPVADQFYGDRSGRIQDPFGHVWILATHVEDVSEEEMMRRMEKMMEAG